MPSKPEGLWPSINPGELRHTITQLNQLTGTDASGANISYVPASPPVTVRAKIQPMKGSDVIRAGQDIAKVPVEITVRYSAVVTWQPNMRILSDNGSVFIIQAIQNVEERNILLVLTCLGLGANE